MSFKINITKNQNYPIKNANNTNNTNGIKTNEDNDSSDYTVDKDTQSKNNAQVENMMNEVGQYCQKSVTNICQISKNGIDVSIFENRHTSICKLTNSYEYANAKTPQSQATAIHNLKSKVDESISKFKDLITDEKNTLEEHGIKNNNNKMSMQSSIFDRRRIT